MPSGKHMIGAGLPQFLGKETAEEKVNKLYDFLVMFLDELQYVLRNLGEENFSVSGIKSLTAEIGSGTDLTEVKLDIAGIHTSVRNAEGNISTLEQTAEYLETVVAGKIDEDDAQTLIRQDMNSITLSATAGANSATITLTADGIDAKSVVARFSSIVADSIVANASIESPVIKSGNGEFELTTDDTPGRDGFIINHVDLGIRTPILRIFYDSLGRLSISSLYEALLTYNANGADHTMELYAPLVKIDHKLSLGTDSWGWQSPIDRQLPGVNGQIYFEVTG